MRTAVKKPAHHATTHRTKPSASVSAHSDTSRAARAAKIGRSRLISRFGAHDPSFASRVVPLPVQPEPDLDLDQDAAVLSQHDNPQLGSSTSHARHQRHMAHAVHKATSHQQSKIKKPRLSHRAAHKLHVSPRIIQVSTGFAAAFLLIGFFVYQNMPNLAMRMAATRAGISAKLPGYQPAGFTLDGNIRYSPGTIAVSYKSTTDDRNFTLLQESTDKTNDELLTEVASAYDQAFQTFQDEGKTIYIYDQNNATWVDGGIKFQIEGNSSLNSDQLLRLANSL